MDVEKKHSLISKGLKSELSTKMNPRCYIYFNLTSFECYGCQMDVETTLLFHRNYV